MRILLCTVMLAGLIGCSSRPFKEESKVADEMMEHMSQGIKYSNGGFPDKFKEDGIRGGYAYGIGKSIYPMEKGEQLGEEAAASNAKFSLIDSAPTFLESEVVKLISSESGSEQEFTRKDISVTKVRNLKGIEVSKKNILCLTRMEPIQGDKKYKISRECRSIARVKVSELKEAYNFTISGPVAKKVSSNKIKNMLR